MSVRSNDTDGSTVPASSLASPLPPNLAASANTFYPASTIVKSSSSSLSAHVGAKEWNPSPRTSPVPPFSDGHSRTSSSSSSSTLTSSSSSSSLSKLNPNKSPFKPSPSLPSSSSSSRIAASANTFYPASSSSSVSPPPSLSNSSSSSSLSTSKKLNTSSASFVPFVSQSTSGTVRMDEVAVQNDDQYNQNDGEDDDQQYDDNDDQQYDDGDQQYDDNNGDNDDSYASNDMHNQSSVHLAYPPLVLSSHPVHHPLAASQHDINNDQSQQPMRRGAAAAFSHPPRFVTQKEFNDSNKASSVKPPSNKDEFDASFPPLTPADPASLTPPSLLSLLASNLSPLGLRSRLLRSSHVASSRLQPDDPAFAELPTRMDTGGPNGRSLYGFVPIDSDSTTPAEVQTKTKAIAATTSASKSKSSAAAAAAKKVSVVECNLDVVRSIGGSVCYKVCCSESSSSQPLLLKRLLAAPRIAEDDARKCAQPWIDLTTAAGGSAAHPTIVALRGVHLMKGFGDATISSSSSASPSSSPASVPQYCLLYDFHALASPIPSPSASSTSSSPSVALAPALVWHYVVQLVSAITSIHAAKLIAGDMLGYGRVLVTNDHRIHLIGAGLSSLSSGVVASSLSAAELSRGQLGDFVQVATLVLGMLGLLDPKESAAILEARLAAIVADKSPASASSAASAASAEVRELVVFARVLRAGVTPSSGSSHAPLTCQYIHRLVAPHMFASFNIAMKHTDVLESEMQKEAQNERFFRIIVKLNSVTERRDIDGGRWSETGDRYMLSLFRELVFHSVCSSSSSSSSHPPLPNLDWGHVIHHLNLVDIGGREKIVLTSADGASMMITRYADIKRMLAQAYAELEMKSRGKEHGDGDEAEGEEGHEDEYRQQYQTQQGQQQSFNMNGVAPTQAQQRARTGRYTNVINQQ